jgi:hypothetical protein
LGHQCPHASVSGSNGRWILFGLFLLGTPCIGLYFIRQYDGGCGIEGQGGLRRSFVIIFYLGRNPDAFDKNSSEKFGIRFQIFLMIT